MLVLLVSSCEEMKDLFGNEVIHANGDERISDILARAGITVVRNEDKTWSFKSEAKTVRAPKGNWIDFVERNFKVKIVFA